MKEKDPWKVDTFEMKGNFKLAIYANEYLDNPSDASLDKFNKELENSSSISIAVVYSYIDRLSKKDETNKHFDILKKLILPQLKEGESTYGVYNPETGEIEYNGVSKKR